MKATSNESFTSFIRKIREDTGKIWNAKPRAKLTINFHVTESAIRVWTAHGFIVGKMELVTLLRNAILKDLGRRTDVSIMPNPQTMSQVFRVVVHDGPGSSIDEFNCDTQIESLPSFLKLVQDIQGTEST